LLEPFEELELFDELSEELEPPEPEPELAEPELAEPELAEPELAEPEFAEPDPEAPEEVPVEWDDELFVGVADECAEPGSVAATAPATATLAKLTAAVVAFSR
jgi:hypothetical protein